jgi:hypothetical protein
MADEFGDVLVLDQKGVKALPEAIRRVCEESGIFLTIEVPGLGRAIVIREDRLGDLIGLFKDPHFADTVSQGVDDFADARGSVRGLGVMPGEERLPLHDSEMASSVERGVEDFRLGRGQSRQFGKFPE